MRNTKIALAVLALVASTAAMANGATVYGTLDVSAAKITQQATHFDGSGNWAGSIFGFTGSEELEGGLKATYEIELGLNAGNGRIANGGTQFNDSVTSTFANRKANVGLAGDFGAIKAGLQLSPYIASVVGNGVATNNESYYVNLLAMSGSASATRDTSSIAGGTTGGFFIPNAISYSTPNMSGFSASVLTQLSSAGVASTNTTLKDAQKYMAASINYAAGDFRVSYGYENANSNLLAAGLETKNHALSGTYNMGPARISGSYIKAKVPVANFDMNTFSIGGAFDVSEKIELSANYARTNESPTKSTLAVFGAQYKLSKSTAMYLTAGRGTNGISPLYSTFGANTATNTTGYAVGMYKSF
jgi:predicted porin